MTLSKVAQGHSEIKNLMVVDYGRYPITGRIVKSFMSLTRDDQATALIKAFASYIVYAKVGLKSQLFTKKVDFII